MARGLDKLEKLTYLISQTFRGVNYGRVVFEARG